MRSLMITAMRSGAGKTVMSCAVMAAWKRRGLPVRSFKCGPDYIDPMFHSRILGIPGRNLDLFLQGEQGVKRSFFREKDAVALVEGAMGYYDGRNGGTEASAWETARYLGIPAVLVVNPRGSGLTLAAQLRGMMSFREESGISGFLLTGCTERTAATVGAVLERECGLPVFGFLPEMKEAEIESRHLGLLTAAEIADLRDRFERIADQAEKSVDLDGLLKLGEKADAGAETGYGRTPAREGTQKAAPEADSSIPRCRIAVAKDEAFCFYYEDNLEALRAAGAELLTFSPLHDRQLPEKTDGLYLGGGYPELYGQQLAENESMRASVRAAVREGVPTVAECGGFLYLQRSLEAPDGRVFPMCGAIPGVGFRTGRLQRFGYLTLYADRDSLLFRRGEQAPAHEFHYWDSTDCGTDLRAEKADGRSWNCVFAETRLYAGFPHLHFGGERPFAERFVKACEKA